MVSVVEVEQCIDISQKTTIWRVTETLQKNECQRFFLATYPSLKKDKEDTG